MTTPPDTQAGYDLALVFKELVLDRVPQPDAAIVLHACCWLLADLITQAAAQQGVPVEQALALVMVQLTEAVGRLTLANAAADDAVLHSTPL